MSRSETMGKRFFSDPVIAGPCFIKLPNEAEALGDVILDKPKVRTHFPRTSGSHLLDEITYPKASCFTCLNITLIFRPHSQS